MGLIKDLMLKTKHAPNKDGFYSEDYRKYTELFENPYFYDDWKDCIYIFGWHEGTFIIKNSKNGDEYDFYPVNSVSELINGGECCGFDDDINWDNSPFEDTKKLYQEHGLSKHMSPDMRYILSSLFCDSFKKEVYDAIELVIKKEMELPTPGLIEVRYHDKYLTPLKEKFEATLKKSKTNGRYDPSVFLPVFSSLEQSLDLEELNWCKNYFLISECMPFPKKKLKEFNEFGWYNVFSMEATLKKVSKPKRKGHRNGVNIYQEVVICDIDTKRELKGVITNVYGDYADIDMWNKGDRVQFNAVYDLHFDNPLRILTIEHVKGDNVFKQVDDSSLLGEERESPEYNSWRRKVLARNNKCVVCGHNKRLEAHHLYGFKENPSLAIDDGNGVALCKHCHRKFHEIYGVDGTTPANFAEFQRKFMVRT